MNLSLYGSILAHEATEWKWCRKNYLFSHNFNLTESRNVEPTPIWQPKELHAYALTRRMWGRHSTSPLYDTLRRTP